MTESKPSRSPFRNPMEETPTILVVDDEVLVRLDISEYLRECGFQVYEAENAARAIEILQAGKGPIHLVFSDLQMPGNMDGIGLAQWIRKNRPGLPILLTSGDAGKSAAAKELCENEPFFGKPYDAPQVVARIRSLVEAGPLR